VEKRRRNRKLSILLPLYSLEDLTPAYEAIARKLSSQYSIGFYPTNRRHEGKYRKTEVKVTKPGLYVQTRKGYYEPDDSKKKR
jgi:hypothetical protein